MSFWKKLGEGQTEENESASAPQGVAGASTPAKSGGVEVAYSSGSGSVSSSSSSDKPDDILIERFGKTRSALGEGTVIQGKLSFDTPIRIDGKLSGEIFSSKVLIVGPTGLIDAKIEVAALIILGSVKGEINASERVEIWSGAAVEGKVKTPAIVVQENSFFSGSCEMTSVSARASASSEGGKFPQKLQSEKDAVNKSANGYKSNAASTNSDPVRV